MALDDQIFTGKQVNRILAEAAERQARDTHSYETEAGEGLRYSQIVETAKEAGIDPKYLKQGAKDPVIKKVELVDLVNGFDKVVLPAAIFLTMGLCIYIIIK